MNEGQASFFLRTNSLQTSAQVCLRPLNYSKKRQISCPFPRQRTLEKNYGKLQLKSGRLEVRYSVFEMLDTFIGREDRDRTD